MGKVYHSEFLILKKKYSFRSTFPSYEGVSKSFRTECITKYTLIIINTRYEATQRVMAAKLTKMTHKIEIKLYLVSESRTTYISRSRRPVRKLLDTPVTTGKKWRLLSLRCFNLYGQASNNYKLMSIKFTDPFLCIFSTSINIDCIKPVTYMSFIQSPYL
jgi:hypothetical protein